MRDLNYELKQLCRRNRDGSYATQRDRQHILMLIGESAQRDGLPAYESGKPETEARRGVSRSAGRWRDWQSAPSRTAWRSFDGGRRRSASKTSLRGSNENYGIANREYVTNVSKARELTDGDLSKITDPYTRLSLKLQAAFGLRRGESIKIQPEWADRGDKLGVKEQLDQRRARAGDPDPQ